MGVNDSKEKKTEEGELTQEVLKSVLRVQDFEQRFAIDTHNYVYTFQNEAKLSNGKVVQLVDGDSSTIVFDGKVVFTGKIRYKTLFKDKLFLTTQRDDKFFVSVMDFKPNVVQGKEPQVREIVIDKNTNMRMENMTGKIWWNTKNSLIKENETMLSVPVEGNNCITSFEVEAD